MITYFLLIIFTGLLGGVISPLLLLPNVSLNATIASSLAQAGQFLGIVHNVVPNTLASLFATLGIYLAIELSIFVYKLIRWLYQKIPTIN